jgi:hypothetical protein
MPTMTIDERMQTAYAQAAATGRKQSKFTKPQNVETANWAVGDKFIIPESFEVIQRKNGALIDEYIFVPVTEAGGNVEVKCLRPSLFSRRATEISDDLEATGATFRAGGAVVDLFKTGKDVDEGMRIVAKKCATDNVQIEIKNIVPVQAFAYGSRTELATQYIATEIEFAQ